MTIKIQTNRVIETFRTLSKKPEGTDTTERNRTFSTTNNSGCSRTQAEKIQALSALLRKNLEKLKNSSENFESDAPRLVIQELLLWEMGDEIYNHPDFKSISNQIAEQLFKNPAIKAQFIALIDELSP